MQVRMRHPPHDPLPSREGQRKNRSVAACCRPIQQQGRLMMRTAIAIILCTAVSSTTAFAGPLVLSGSSTVQKLILEPCQKALEKKTGIVIDSPGPGTIHGMKALMKGEVAAATASCPLDVVF